MVHDRVADGVAAAHDVAGRAGPVAAAGVRVAGVDDVLARLEALVAAQRRQAREYVATALMAWELRRPESRSIPQ